MESALRRFFAPGRTMIGRAHELATLTDAYRDAGNTPAAVVISGEAGIGKSRLVSEFVAGLAPGRAVRGSCLQLAGEPLPFAAVEEALQQLPVGRADPVSRQPRLGLGETGSQLRQFDRWLDHIETLADDDGPAVLVVEDLHWADESTLGFVSYLARSLPRRRVMLVMTRRDDQPAASAHAAEALAELVRVPHVRSVALGRLSPDEARDLATSLSRPYNVGPLSATDVELLYQRSEGNPYLFIELAATPGDVPVHVSDLLLVRLRRLDSDAQSLVRLAAVAGLSVDDRLLWRASMMDEDRYLAALRAAVDAGVLLPESKRYIFRHSLTRDALLGQLLPLELRRLHAAVATSLELDQPLGDAMTHSAIALHWYAAGDRGRAVPAAIAAGRSAFVRHAYAEAWHHFERALELSDSANGEPGRADLLTEAAESARWSGDIAAGVRLLQRALPHLRDRATQARMHERLGRYHWEAGDTAASHAAFSSAIDLLAGAADPDVRARVLAARARASVIMTAFARAATEAAEAIEAARQCRLQAIEADALITLGVAVAVPGTGDGVACIRHALGLLDQDDDLEIICRGYSNLAFVLEHLGRHDEAADSVIEALRVVERHGLELTAGATLATNAAAILVNRGRYDECEALLDRLLSRGPLQGQALQLFVERAAVEAARGQTAAARLSLQAAAQLASSTEDPWVVLSLVLVETEVLLLEGHFDQARDTVIATFHRLAETEDDEIRARLCRLGLRVEADRVAAVWVRSGRNQSAEAATWMAELIPRGDGEPTTSDTIAECVTARAEAARIERQDTADAWADAAERWRRAQRPLDLAYCRLREAERSSERRWAQRAADALGEASEVATRLGAVPILEAVEAIRRRTKLPLPRPGKTSAAVPRDPCALTKKEEDVLALVAQGATNREIGRALFMAERTAATHISSILRKLGVDNRVQAAAFATSKPALSSSP